MINYACDGYAVPIDAQLGAAVAGSGSSEPVRHPIRTGTKAVRVFEKLRISLTRFAGADGFTALLRRALVLARSDVPSLQSVKVTADGRLEGFEEISAAAKG